MQSVGGINLWALGYDDPGRAVVVREEVKGFEGQYCLHVLDAITVTRLPDGTYTFKRDEEPSTAAGIAGFGTLGFLVGLVALQPLAGAAIGTALGSLVTTAAKQLGIDDTFISEVKELIMPNSSALFLLTSTNNLPAVLFHIQGLGGVVLKTNVDADLAQQVQESLNAPRK